MMDRKKLESRIARLEKLLNGTRKVNEGLNYKNYKVLPEIKPVWDVLRMSMDAIDTKPIARKVYDISEWSDYPLLEDDYDDVVVSLGRMLSHLRTINDRMQ